MIFARLPYMVDPLGRHWRQPKGLRNRVRIYETHATILAQDWRALPVYDSSYPSGVYAGKVWRRGPYLCWYGRDKGKTCRIGYARALLQGPGENLTYRANE